MRVWEDTLELPTDEEGPPDVNPPFDLFVAGRFSYPYTLRESFTGRQVPMRYRALHLENEHLKVVVLPELGGHLYSCVDKANGAEMFYTQRSIRKARIAYRGAWAAFGIEFNFPVSHNWVSMSPVDSALVENEDGSASIWVANVDRVYGMQWRVELRLRPGIARLEQEVALYNPGPVRHRFYWWNNAAVRVTDESRIHYPMRHTASHWFREIDTWPVTRAGVDLSRVGNHLDGPVSLFSHGSREPFMGVYHPDRDAGVVHYSSPEDAPTKKFWSWGGDADGLDWRRALSDDQSAYVEVQAGLFRNQETYAFLEPQESIRFVEHWLPVRETSGITRANPEAVVHVERAPAANGTVDLRVGLNVTARLAGGRLRVRDGDRVVAERPLDLTPAQVFADVQRGLPATPRYAVEVADADGRIRIAHTEDSYDVLPASEVQLGDQPVDRFPPEAVRSEGDFVAVGAAQEREGKRLVAWRTYAGGLERFPESFLLRKAAGRLAVDLVRTSEAIPLLSDALARGTNDAEVQHYLALAYAAEGRDERAQPLWEAARTLRAFRPAALVELARLHGRRGELPVSLARVRDAIADSPDSVRAGALEVVLLRRLGRADEAKERLLAWRRLDPTAVLLREEAVRLGSEDRAFEAHLAADPERVLDLAAEYMGLGLFDDALAVLDRPYPKVVGLAVEPGTPAPRDHPVVAYFRGYCRERSGGSGQADFEAASRLSTRYVFPGRAEALPVLRRAIEVDPDDATARFLLGSLLLSGGRAEEAIEQWQRVRRLAPSLPVLHRNLGRALLHARADARGALATFKEGISVDRRNDDLYAGADQAASLLGVRAAERVRLLQRYPDRRAMPPSLVQKLALAMTEAGRAAAAESLFAGRLFPREEGGTNVRQVFVEVRLRRATALAGARRCRQAIALLNELDRPVPRIAFTADGMGPFVASTRVQYMIGEALARCGRDADARDHFTRAVQGRDGFFVKAPFAALAARRLGGADEAGQRRGLEQALADAAATLEQGTGFPGIVTYAQGMMLRVLGREDEARDRFRRVFLLPDQRLAHFLGRRALEGGSSH